MTVGMDEARLLLRDELEKQGNLLPSGVSRICRVFERWKKVIEVDPVHR
jgi:hypothetical protein